jgi:hypothetical protein
MSLGKNHMSKYLLNLLVQISKAMVYSKIKFYSKKNFSRHFRPIRPFRPSRGTFSFFSTGRFPSTPPMGLGLPAGPAQPATFFLLPHWSRARPAPPASLAPPPGSTLTPPLEEKKTAASIPFIPPLLDAVSPSSIIGNRQLQRRPLKLLQRRPLKTLGLTSAL